MLHSIYRHQNCLKAALWIGMKLTVTPSPFCGFLCLSLLYAVGQVADFILYLFKTRIHVH